MIEKSPEPTLSETLEHARNMVPVAEGKLDQRTSFEVYQDVARVIAHLTVGPQLENVDISPSLKEHVIEMTAYGYAQPTHLFDGASNTAGCLTLMLDELESLDPSSKLAA